MASDYLTAGPEDSVHDAAARMTDRWVGSAVLERDSGPPGIVTERDVVEAAAAGVDVRRARVADHATSDAASVTPDWSLERAAARMIEGDFRHLVVRERGRTVGVVSLRDLVRTWTDEGWRRPTVPIRAAMGRDFLCLDRARSLRHAAARMVERGLGAAVIEPPKPRRPPGIVTDRDILKSVAEGDDPEQERVEDHLSARMTFSAQDWSLKQAAESMTKGGFQHVIVVDAGGTVGVISMRDIVRRLLD